MHNLPRVEGLCSRQAHADFPEGTYERELGQEGFFGLATHMMHKNAHTAWTKIEGPLQPHAWDLTKLHTQEESPWKATDVLTNEACRVRWWNLSKNMDHLVRNADGDELLFIHKGKADLFCDYGHLTIETGDYVLLPRGTMWRLEVIDPLKILMTEATGGAYRLPDKGMVGPHAIFDPAMMDMPKINDPFKAQQSDQQETRLVIKRRNQLTTFTFPFNPLDAVGWHGNLIPIRINVKDIRPLMSHRFHLPPSAHTTFVARRFVVCTFAPRPIESDPGALKVPFYHNNDDYDEFIFYHAGEFFSRDNIHPGMTTFHPAGFAHGPHPGAFKKGTDFSRKETDEYAVMIDFRDAANISPDMEKIAWKEYVHSWKGITKP